MTETDEYVTQMLDFEKSAYDAAAGGDFATAVSVWNQIVTEPAYRDFFNRVDGALAEIYWNLATAYWQLGDDASRARSRDLLGEGGLDEAEFLESVGAEVAQ